MAGLLVVVVVRGILCLGTTPLTAAEVTEAEDVVADDDADAAA